MLKMDKLRKKSKLGNKGDLSNFHALELIRHRLSSRQQSIATAIKERHLYFRISILGACNLACPFCHNEGGPHRGKLDIALVTRAIYAARELGFRRIQFTGGEPLMHPKIDEFIGAARRIIEDVGVTTNGTFLPKKLDGIVSAGLSRIHISLQAEALCPAGHASWVVPNWLGRVLDLSRGGTIKVRLNIPVQPAHLKLVKAFLCELSPFGCDVNLFSILPQTTSDSEVPSTHSLEQLAAEENVRRSVEGAKGKILVRGYRHPNGLRCATCDARSHCKEQSHSLRLGVDRVLHPCLATRKWDIKVTETGLCDEMERATLLALDYTWPATAVPYQYKERRFKR